MFCYEEAHNLFPKLPTGEHSILSECSRKGREFKVSLAFTSHTTMLDDLLLNNIYCQIFKQMTNPRDVFYVKNVCKLNNHQETDFTMFDHTQGIVKMAGMPPYKCVFPYIDLPEVKYE